MTRHAKEWLRRRKPQRIALTLLAGVSLLVYWSFPPQQGIEPAEYLACRYLPGASDVVVVMKTGVTQIEDKLPTHLKTTMNCYPNSVIWSDHEEQFQGWEVRDVLSNIDPALRMEHDDFELYRHVKAVGREGLDLGSLTGTSSSRQISKDQKHTISGWVLDKWKFLPMLNET